MRKMTGMFAALILVFILAGTAMADTTITVSGTGETLVPADMAIISLGVTARDRDVLKAQSRVNKTIMVIRKALVNAGISEEDINTDYINIYAMYDYRDDQEELTAYNANSTLAIRTVDMDQVGEIIDIAFGAGANTLNGINFSATDTAEAEQKALSLAVENANSKAEALAAASGLAIQGITAVNEGGTYSYDRGVANNFYIKAEAAADAMGGTVVQAAQLTVTANISITYQAEDAR